MPGHVYALLPLYAFMVRTGTTLPLPLPRVTTASKDSVEWLANNEPGITW